MVLKTYSGFALSSAVMVAETLLGYPASAWTISPRCVFPATAMSKASRGVIMLPR